jgi:ADP-ribosylarginine hydrolase
MENRYIACFVLGAVGDTIGFKNGEWEFDSYDEENHDEVLSKIGNTGYGSEMMKNYLRIDQFIELGGYTGINLKGWYVSDDTILHNALGASFIDDFATSESLITRILSNFNNAFSNNEYAGDSGEVDRAFGTTTIKKIKQYRALISKKEIMPKDVSYDKKGGGSGSSMRTMCIGLVYHREEDLDKLLNVSIFSSLLTHGHPIGYLGGMVSALFTSYAIRGVEIEKWSSMLLELFESDKIDNMVEKLHQGEMYKEGGDNFIQAWKDYHNFRYKKGKVHFSEKWKYSPERFNYFMKEITGKYNTSNWVGSSGIDSVIFAYDCLLYCDGSFEKLIYYSTLHCGDSDTTGIIACSWFGAVYGFEGVSKNMYENLEFKEGMISLGQTLYKSYGMKK